METQEKLNEVVDEIFEMINLGNAKVKKRSIRKWLKNHYGEYEYWNFTEGKTPNKLRMAIAGDIPYSSVK